MTAGKPNPIELQKYLKGMHYPAKKQDLLKHAQENGADENVQKLLEQLKEEEFNSPADVSKAVGEL